MPRITTKRVYDPPAPNDGLRVLVDRLWPRGLSRERAAVDLWLKDIAPSDNLRRWFDHAPARWEAFRERYQAELAGAPAVLQSLRTALAGHQAVTLLFAAKDAGHNNAVALKAFLESNPSA